MMSFLRTLFDTPAYDQHTALRRRELGIGWSRSHLWIFCGGCLLGAALSAIGH